MNIFFFILGGPGETYVESWGIKVSWGPHQTGYIYRIVPNRRALREWRPLGARLLISSEAFILFCQLR